MVQKFKNFLVQEKLFQPHEKVLLAISGGVDSVVMAHLFRAAKLHFGIAHCNFQLRGTDADEDAIFVKNLAHQFGVAHFEIAFATADYAATHKLSIQVAARNLRYEWLEKVRFQNGFQYIATAHHQNDSLETILYNFTKGCGIRGLHGILPKNKKVIRPLLFFQKKEILDFVEKKEIQHREDISNASDKYARNHIRHRVIPALEKINPSLFSTAAENTHRLRETEVIFDYAIRQLKAEICETRADLFFISIPKLMNAPAPATLLFEWLSPHGFNNTHTKQMLASVGHQAGALFRSSTHQVLLDRNFFILKKNDVGQDQHFLIDKNRVSLTYPNGQLTFEQLQNRPSDFSNDKNVAYLDLTKIQFPILLRKWKAGDVFRPFGMNGKSKKVKNYLTDLKLNRFEKDNTWVMESGGKICWVVGKRLAHDFALDENANEILKVTLQRLRF